MIKYDCLKNLQRTKNNRHVSHKRMCMPHTNVCVCLAQTYVYASHKRMYMPHTNVCIDHTQTYVEGTHKRMCRRRSF
jgi:hypothetical protein